MAFRRFRKAPGVRHRHQPDAAGLRHPLLHELAAARIPRHHAAGGLHQHQLSGRFGGRGGVAGDDAHRRPGERHRRHQGHPLVEPRRRFLREHRVRPRPQHRLGGERRARPGVQGEPLAAGRRAPAGSAQTGFRRPPGHVHQRGEHRALAHGDDGLRGAIHRRPLRRHPGGRQRRRVRRSTGHARVDRPLGAGGAPTHGDGHRSRPAARESGTAGGPHRNAGPRTDGAHRARLRDRRGLPRTRGGAGRGRPFGAPWRSGASGGGAARPPRHLSRQRAADGEHRHHQAIHRQYAGNA